MKRARLSPNRTQQIITDLAWAMATGLALVVAFGLTVFGVGP